MSRKEGGAEKGKGKGKREGEKRSGRDGKGWDGMG